MGLKRGRLKGRSRKRNVQGTAGKMQARVNLECPSTQYLRTLVPNTTKGMVVETRVLKYWVLGPSGECGALLAHPGRLPTDLEA